MLRAGDESSTLTSRLWGETLLDQKKLDLLARGDPDELNVHLSLIEKEIEIQGTKTKAYCHYLPPDANGKIGVARLAEFMRGCAVEYAIPREKIALAKDRDAKFGQSNALVSLYEIAKRTFTHLENSGEGGELLVFLLAERFLKLPQVLCKMDLKTAAGVHFHGCDGVYGQTDGEKLILYWGESKVFDTASSAIRACLASLAPFLLEPETEDAERERDLLLLSDKANLSDPDLIEGFKNYFDKTKKESKRVEYRGIALAGFDFVSYPADTAKGIAADIEAAIHSEMKKWVGNLNGRLDAEKLTELQIHFFLLPLPSADTFRTEFLKALGLK